jgi:hypothetical protein
MMNPGSSVMVINQNISNSTLLLQYYQITLNCWILAIEKKIAQSKKFKSLLINIFQSLAYNQFSIDDRNKLYVYIEERQLHTSDSGSLTKFSDVIINISVFSSFHNITELVSETGEEHYYLI